MNNRNLILFVVLSSAMLLGYYAWVGRMAQPPQQAQQVLQVPQTATPAPEPPRTAVAVTQPAIDPGALFTLANNDLRLTWRKQDGALVQAIWLQDGTTFFQEANDAKHQKAFPGIGGALATLFDGDPEVAIEEGRKTVLFKNAAGDRLSYLIPDRGHVLHVDWSTQRNAHLQLIRMPSAPEEALHMGRVFTLDEKSVNAVPWMDILKDPFFSFLGFKRKELPQSASRLGIDAGVESARDTQSAHYFAAIWEVSRLPERDLSMVPGYHVQPDAEGHVTARLYLGPKEADSLKAFGPAYTQALDWGFFGLIAQGMFWVLKTLQRVIPNWGWTLVIFSVLLRLALWPMNNKTTLQMLRMKDLEPHQKALQAKYEKFGNDMAKKSEMQKELMAFYKKNGHNPMGGCLIMLLQMPVFLALWSMLNAVYALRGAHWMLWIKDLSAKDPYFVLPVLLGASMLAQQVMTPATGDPTQRKMMLILMPAMMTFFFISAPVGLSLYYLVFNLMGMLQTWWVMRNYTPQPVKV